MATGFEGSLMNTLSRSLNFVPNYQRETDGNYFGLFNKDKNSFNGLLGDLQVLEIMWTRTYFSMDSVLVFQYARTDIGMANLWIRADTFAYFEFSTPYNYDGLCFGIPMPKDKTDYLSLLRPMSLATW